MAAVIKKVGVIGAGQMGNGIAHVAALAGFDVVLNDVSADRLKSGMATINGNLARQVSKKAVSEDDKTKAMARSKLRRVFMKRVTCSCRATLASALRVAKNFHLSDGQPPID